MDYKNAKIYCIRNYINDDIYIGSSCQPLSKRMADHRIAMNSKRDFNMSLYVKMREHGANNFYIELLEEYPCKNKEQLRAKEGEYIRSLSTLNKRIEGRTIEEWRKDNEEYLKERYKSYYTKNKQKIQQYKQEYAKINKTKIQEYKKEYSKQHQQRLTEKSKKYYEDNKETIKSKINVKILCECGEEISKSNLLRHQRTQKHQEGLNNLNNINNNVSLQSADLRTDGKDEAREEI